MKSTIKLFLVVVLFCSTAFADGNMGNGGKTCTSNCIVADENTEKNTNEADQKQSDNSVLDFVKDYLFSIFG